MLLCVHVLLLDSRLLSYIVNPIQGTWNNTSDDALQVSTVVHTLLGLTTAHPLIRH